MVKFGKKLLENIHDPWKEYYLDYKILKKRLKQGSTKVKEKQNALLLEQDELEKNGDKVSLDLSSNIAIDTSIFVEKLEEEIEKVVLFFLEEQGKIASVLASLAKEYLELQHRRGLKYLDLQHRRLKSTSSLPPSVGASSLQTMYQKYYLVAVEFLNFIHFVNLNITGIRKILKKHDKVTGQHLSVEYRNRSRSNHPGDNHLKQLYSYEGISALNTSLSEGITKMKGLESSKVRSSHRRVFSALRTMSLATGLSVTMLQSEKDEEEEISQNVLVLSPESNNVSSYGTSSAAVSVDPENASVIDWGRNLSIVMRHIETSRNRLDTTVTLQELLAGQMADAISYNDDDTSKEFDQDNRPSATSNLLNLMSTFLYMTNYYIIAPTSGAYAARLGSSPALAGVIIGMTPVAALASTVLYSWWTSYSYKNALIFASICSVLGNLLYAAALPCNSINMVLIGRLLNGFGSARSINRRYIADSFPNNERTSASAAFVTAGALGMSAGPALATMLHIGNPDPLNTYWTVENSPGWVMLFAWSVYVVFLILFFEDPPSIKDRDSNEDDIELNEEQPLLDKQQLAELPHTNSRGSLQDSNRSGFTDDVSVSSASGTAEPAIYRNVPVMTTFVIYFMLKMVLECLLSSSATVTTFYFDWSSSHSGIYLAIMSLFILPANVVVTYFTKRYDDRELIFYIQIIMVIGCVGIINYSTSMEDYNELHYIIASSTIFIAANALEGPNMSLLSKTIPSSYSKGIFNVGLLATESGTFGRAIADFIITAFASKGVEYLLNYCFGMMSISAVTTFLITWYYYDYLEKSD